MYPSSGALFSTPLSIESLGLRALCNALLTLVGIWVLYILIFCVLAIFAHYFNVADLLYTALFFCMVQVWFVGLLW